ncbi:MAG TPA: carboxypeptidase regulatory-like domain-containing protein [Firmicutes bacterium]|nr:carboxypeptidase regulatory-like domain-containing protein [Bacillota bacterium]
MSLRTLLRRLAFPAVGLLAVTITLAGCFGGGQVSPPKPQVVSISGTVTAPNGTPIAFTPSLLQRLFAWCAVVSAAPREDAVPGAKVVAVNFADGKQVGTTATTDQSGRFTISQLPKGIDIVVIATKEVAPQGGARIRLSTLIPDVGTQNIIASNINATSTIAAEAWGIHYRKGLNIGPRDFKSTLDAATRFVERQNSLNLTEGAGIITTGYGNGLHQDSGAGEVEGTVPSSIDGRVWPAKEMIQDLRDAGLSLKGTYEQQLQVQGENIETKVGPYFAEVASHVGGLHPWIINFDPGVYEEHPDGVLMPIAPRPEGDWIIRRYGDIYYEEHWKASLSTDYQGVKVLKSASFEVTRPSEAGFIFEGNLLIDYTTAGNSTLPIKGTFTAKLQDARSQFLAQATTFDGQYSGQFNNDATAGSATFTGKFASPVVNATGQLVIEGDIASGSADISFNGSVTTDTACVEGTIELALVRSSVMTDTAVPKLIALNGSLKEPGASAPLFQGNFEISIENASTFDFGSPVSQNNWPKGHIQFGGYVEAQGHPRVSATVTIGTQEYLKFNSTVSYAHNGHTLNGTIAYDGITGVAAMNIKNQAGLVTTMNGSGFLIPGGGTLSGSIKNSAGTKVADITTDVDGLVRVVYIDDSWETLF